MMLSPVSRPKSFKSKKRPGVGEAWCLPPPAGTTKPLAAVISISSALELSTNYKASPDHETELLALTIVHEATRVGLWGCGFRIRRRFAAMDFNQNMQLADLGERGHPDRNSRAATRRATGGSLPDRSSRPPRTPRGSG